MNVLQAIVLGAVQGLTEFLPVSSKTHLVVVPALMGWKPPSLAFIVWLHLGTLIALIGYFRNRLVELAVGIKDGSTRPIVTRLAIATVPAAAAGLLFEKQVEKLLESPALVALALIGTALLLVVGEKLSSRQSGNLTEEVQTKHAVAMGFAQAVALLPGISRSGSTIAAGLASGMTRSAATEFSFLMSVAVVTAAIAKELPIVFAHGIGGIEVAGLLSAFAFGLAAVAGLMRLVRHRSLYGFAIYCAAFGVLAALAIGQ